MSSHAVFATGIAIRSRAPARRAARQSALAVTARLDNESFVLGPFIERRALKIIAGLKNFDEARVSAVVRAAAAGGATHVDIAADPALVKAALALTSLPVCVSAVDVPSLVAAVAAGAHMVELGNYDPFYAEGRTFSAAEVLELTKATRSALPYTPLSVTVPHTLELDEQVTLAIALEAAGADIIQTEGGMAATPEAAGVLGLIQKASPTLAAAYAISAAVRVPVMCASGLSAVTAPLAIAAGAAGVGVGSAINKLNDQISMIAAVRSIKEAMGDSAARSSVASTFVPVSRI